MAPPRPHLRPRLHLYYRLHPRPQRMQVVTPPPLLPPLLLQQLLLPLLLPLPKRHRVTRGVTT